MNPTYYESLSVTWANYRTLLHSSDWKVIRYICSYYRNFKVVIKDRICNFMINC